MHVLFINTRSDSRRNPGGDNVQLDRTRLALERLGVRVAQQDPHNFSKSSVYDLAHLFNIQEAETAWSVFEDLQSWGIPVALSSIYWDMNEFWASNALRDRRLWKMVARIFGRSMTTQIHIRWQRMKAPNNTKWKMQRKLLNRADRVLPNSVSESRLLQSIFLLRTDFTDKVDVIPNGIDLEFYVPRPNPDEHFCHEYGLGEFILQVGSINPVKNQLGLIQALYDLPVPLVFIGQVSDAYPKYGQACKDAGSERGQVYIIDHLPFERLPSIFTLAAVHALPSWRETPGLASLEAGAAGCRVVTTSIGSTPDYFGDLAWYCHPAVPVSIRSAVEAALSAKPSIDLRNRVIQEFTWDKAGEKTLISYMSMLAQK